MPNKNSAKRRRAKRPSNRKPFLFALSARETAIVQNWEAAFALSPKLTAVVNNCSLSTIYDRLGKGEYQAVKDGHSTKITTESIKARRAKLPRAEYKPAPSNLATAVPP